MDEFRTIAKMWPTGAPLSLGTDSNMLGGSANFTREAPKFVTDGVNSYQFLFWNTGRHLTNKRRVIWNFSVLNWGTWTATRWYGIPPPGPGGVPRVRADAFLIGGDMLSGDTPINAGASTFASGAYPLSGDDHVIGTAAGAANVVAKDPFNGYDFAGWLQLIWGGDDTGDFIESDAGSGGVIGGSGFYDHVVGGSFAVAKGASADLLATFGYHASTKPPRFHDWFEEYIHDHFPKIPDVGDPGPMDRIRLKILEQLLLQTQPEIGIETGFQRLIEAAPKMSAEELKRSLTSLKTTLDLGKSAIDAIEAQMKRKTR
jgi:hypothetical protein